MENRDGPAPLAHDGQAPLAHAPLVPFVAAALPSRRIRVAIIGSTGSVGRHALAVVGAHPDVFEVVALAAGRSVEVIAEQVRATGARIVGLTGGDQPDTGADALVRDVRGAIGSDGGTKVDVIGGAEVLETVATLPEVDVVLVATSGRAALPATLAALRSGRDVALANKESLVVAGPLVVEAVRQFGGRIYPVDSEHSALWQCVLGEVPEAIRRLTLTASGGPFRTWDANRIAHVTVAEALRHPTWQMGPKITIDSATLMNKGLEAIEAHWMFGVGFDRIETAVHPTSIVHSLVEFVDGSSKAQLGWPDMRPPIQLALTRGARLVGRRDPADPASRPLSLVEIGALQFEAVDLTRFPCLRLALDAGRIGGTAPAVLSAADEIAVEAFLGGAIRFGDIADVVAGALDDVQPSSVESLEHLLSVDDAARAAARRRVLARTN
jgi:1-deoxy-D-xylulose-5-phosphate reductoisomerase